MRNFLTAVLGLAVLAGVANANNLNLWVTQSADTPGTPSVPVAAPGDVLTLWGTTDAGDKWIGINFDLGTSGTGEMINDEFIFAGSGLTRWEAASNLTGSYIGMVSVTTQGLGSALDDIKVNEVFKLGTITVAEAPGTLQGSVGFARSGAIAGQDDIIIGGETSFKSDDNTTVATLWTPEPASLVLIALASLVIRRR